MTVLEVIQRSAEFLGKKGVDSPRLQAELLLAHQLKLARMQLYLKFDRVLTAEELDGYRGFIRRRASREPLQHIIGSSSFCGFELAVNRHVLVPRPETELLAEKAWGFLNETAHRAPAVAGCPQITGRPDAAPTAVDFGTGSGCLAIAMAAKCPSAQVLALDLSAEALEVARQNALSHGVAERVRFQHGDGFAALVGQSGFDLLVSNPPYIPTAELDTLEPEVRDFDPRGALDGGPDGLDFFRRLAAEARPVLHAHGKLMAEFGDGQGPAISQLFQQQNWIVESLVQDYTQRPRILIARQPSG